MLNSIKKHINEKYFGASFHLDTGELNCPKCGIRSADVEAGLIPLPNPFEVTVQCPICGENLSYKYIFEADFSCAKDKPSLKTLISSIFHKDLAEIKHQLRLFGIKFCGIPHYIQEHTDVERKDADENGEKVFLRKCICGKNTILKQRRVL